jgi:serine/threonine protein phosphatase PrpC
MGIIYSGMSDIGRKRKTNQDAIYMSESVGFFLVADGMGGHNGGDIASQMAVTIAPEFFKANMHRLDDPQILVDCFRYINESIYKKSASQAELQGMGTTLVCLYFSNAHLYVANVGDSRAYLISQGNLYQLTRDHSLIQEKMNLGIYSRQEAQADRQKNVLVRTIGFEENVEVDVFNYKLNQYDLMFICSDGLHGKVSDRDIHYLITANLTSPEQYTQKNLDKIVQSLVHQANENGGQDNISVILVAVV